MKKYKLFIFTIAIAIMSVITVNARSMTVAELGQAAIDQYKDSGQDVGYIYVIGEYAFTSQYDIKTEDIMLAAKSINLEGKDPVKYEEGTDTLTEAYKKMVINTIRAQVDDDFNISGWEIATAAVGTTNVNKEDKLNIRFIDYVFQPETSKAEIKFDKTTEEAYQGYLTSDFGISDVSKLYDGLTYTDGKLTGLMLKHEIEKGFPDKDKTGYYLPFVIEVPDLTNETTVTIEEDSKVTATYDNFDIKTKEEGKNPGIVVLWSIPGENGKKSITIVVDIDGEEKDEYGPTTYTIDYTELRFQQESKATIATDNLPASDVESIKENWGYKKEEGDTYTLSAVEGSTRKYKLTGTIVKQTINDNVFNEEEMTGYYFLFNVGVDSAFYDKATVTYPGDGDTKTDTIKNETGVTILFSTSDTTKSNKIIIKVDLDGTGNEYFPVEYEIDLSEVILEKSSEFTVTGLTDEGKFEQENGWYADEDGYYATVTVDEHDKTLYHVSGVLPIVEDDSWNIEGITPDEEELYYLGLLLNLTEKETSGVVKDNINVKFFHNTEEDKKVLVSKEDFDGQKNLYILKALAETTNAEDKKFTITVDLDGDGEGGKQYAPYTVTIDWSNLVLQTKSIGNTNNYEVISSETALSENETEKTELSGYKYDYTKDSDVVIDTDSQPGIKGKIKEQTLDKSSGFDELDGYFVPIKIEFPGKDMPKFEKYNNSWTLILNTGEDTTREYTPTQAEYEQGWVMVLFKLKNDGTKEIKYSIDFDGTPKEVGNEEHKGYDFLPQEYTISYQNLEFLEAQEVKVNGVTEENVSIYLGEPIPTEILTKLEEEQVNSIDEELQPYRDFTYFTTSDGTTQVDETTPVTKDMLSDGSLDLTPHWNLYSDKFVADVLKDLNNTEDSKSENFNTEFVVEDYVENSGEITINVINPDVKVARMNDTSIPGAIAHILLEDEIKEITLVADSGNSKTFTKGDASDKETLKGTIKDEVKSLYSSILSSSFGGDENSITLSQLAQNETYKTFTLKINTENIADNVTLSKAPAENGISLASDIAVPTEYKITFKSDIVSVNTLQLLKEALKGSAKTIFISGEFDVTEKLDVARPVTINGDNKALTASGSIESIFNVTSSNVTIENLTLKAGTDTKTLVTVENSGDLTASNLTITPDESENKLEAAIDVKNGGKVTITGMQYDKEHYNHPAVRAAKDNVTVNLTNTESSQAKATEKEKITEQLNGNDSTSKDDDYNSNYRNYYNDSKNSKIYRTELYNYQAGSRLTYIKYNYYNENVKIPTDNRFANFTYNGETYTLIGFSESSYNILTDQDTPPEGGIKKEELKATKDNGHYWAVYKLTLKEGVTKVSTVENFINALKNDSIHEIYFDTDSKLEIDLTQKNEEGLIKDGVLTINRDLSIIGKSKLNVTIKAKKIEIADSVKSVLINRVNLDIAAAGEGQDSLIEVKGSKLSLWQSNLKNTGESVDYAIKYSNDKAIVDVRFMGRGTSGKGFEGSINKAYIYVSGKLAAGSDLYSNEFDSIEGIKTSTIIINGFADDASIKPEEDNEPAIRFENNSVSTPYAIVFTKNTSGQNADIKLGNSQIKIGIEYADDKKNFEGIGLFANPQNVELAYLTETESGEYQEQSPKPQDVKDPKFKSTFTMVES